MIKSEIVSADYANCRAPRVEMKKSDTISFTYRFLYPDSRIKSYDIVLDRASGKMLPNGAQSGTSDAQLPSWTKLEHHQCSHCPLKSTESPHCPIAVNLARLADDFKTEKSTEPVTVEVITHERTYRKDLRLQEGLFGVFGLIMATSDCPYLAFLRPMARFHLPFSTMDETTARSVSFYLLRQYFVAKSGGQPDFELKEFAKLYQQLDEVNLGLCNRIRSITKADVEANAIVVLDGFAKILSFQLSNGLKDLEKIF